MQTSPQSSLDSSSSPADGERHPKGRRNRTRFVYSLTLSRRLNWPSMLTGFCCRAEDKAVLEEAYLKNSKPDKAARLEILSRVSMHNEKAVQVSPAPVRMGLAPQLLDASQCRLNGR